MVTRKSEHTLPYRYRRGAWIGAALVVGLFAGLAGIYGIGGFIGNVDAAECRPALDLARRIAPLAQGEVAALTLAETPLRVPDLSFRDAAGAPHRLSEWRGRAVLLNLWATWCVPCRKEMPALDALQGKLGGPGFDVLAINIDTRDREKPRAWLHEVGVNRLTYYADETARSFRDLKSVGRAFGMPTTLLIDPAGCEIGNVAGPAEWASADAIKLVSAVLQR